MTPSIRSPWYKNMTLVIGLVLLALGLGNWITGTVRMADYADRIARSRAVPSQGGVSASSASAEEVEIARGRVEFYHVVASGGRFMTAAGLLFATFGLARSLRPQARRG